MVVAALLVAVAAAAAAGGAAPTLERVGFQEAVRRSLARATSAVVAAEEVRRAEGILGEARSAALPSLGVYGTLSRLDADRLSQGRVIAGKEQASGNLALSVPLVAPSRWAGWAHASQALDATVASEADVRRAVAVTAARAYLTVIAQRRAVEVSDQARETARAHFEYAHSRRAGGVGNALDELRAEQELAASEVQAEQAYTQLARAREGLGQIAGEDRPLEAAEEPGLPELGAPAQALSEAEALRADLKAARARADAAERVSKDSWADWLPTLLGSFQGLVQQPPTLTTPHTGWQAQLILSFPLFEGGLRPAQAKERDALSREAEVQLDGLLRQARSEVRLSFESLRRARAAHAAARRGAESAKAALDLASQAYRAGAVDNLAVTDAEQRARNAATSAVIAEDGVRQSLLDLLAAAGRFP
jgi:outer membrane protein TolC